MSCFGSLQVVKCSQHNKLLIVTGIATTSRVFFSTTESTHIGEQYEGFIVQRTVDSLLQTVIDMLKRCVASHTFTFLCI